MQQTQLDLDVPEIEGLGKPNSGEPLFWIRELRILSEWGSGKEHEINRIQFRKGLNVIWSPPTNEPSGKTGGQNAEQRISGHASGKTTLCRMIRYVLGEQKIGTEAFRNSATHAFPMGWVVAEISLDGEVWCVARPFTSWTASRGIAEKFDNLDDFLKEERTPGSFETFRMRMEEVAKKIVPFKRLPDDSNLTLWHYFPWFTRDQEAQFLKLCQWRENTASEADSPMLKQGQKVFVMRAIYDPESQDEFELEAEYERLDAAIEQGQKDEIKFAAACENDKEWIANFKSLSAVDIDNPLLTDSIVNDLIKAQAKAEELPIEVSAKKTLLERDVQDSYREYDDAQSVLAQCVAYRKRLHARLNELEKTASQALTPPPPEDRVIAAMSLRPDDRFCRVPRLMAEEMGCSAYRQFKGDALAKEAEKARLHQKAEESVASQKTKIENQDAIVAKARKDFEATKAKYDECVRRRDAYSSEVEQNVRSKVKEYSDAITALTRYKLDAEKLSKTRTQIETDREKRKEVSARLTNLRNSREGLGDVSGYFFHVARFVLGDKVVGRVTSDKDSIKIDCTYNDAAYNSAALDASYNVMFDVAVMTMGIQGKSTHPRFLLHDGPRVADLSPSIYQRYFEFAADLEKRAGGKPNFQYIITTTEPPPPEFQVEPYLRLRLDASRPEDRLLKRDL